MTTRCISAAQVVLVMTVGGCGAAFSDEELAEFDTLFTVSGVVERAEEIAPGDSIRIAMAWRAPNDDEADFWVAGDTDVFSDGNELRFSLGLLRLPPSSLRKPVDNLNVEVPAGSRVSVGRLVAHVGSKRLKPLTKLVVGKESRIVGVAADLAVLYVESATSPHAGELGSGFQVVRFGKPCPEPSLCRGGVSVPTREGRFGRREAADLTVAVDAALATEQCVSKGVDSELYCIDRRTYLQQQDGVMFTYEFGKSYSELEKHACCPVAHHPAWRCNPGHVTCPQGLNCCSDLTCQESCKKKRGSAWKLIPAGKFTMGSPPGELCREDDELAHDVIISRPFYISSHEVTQAEFKLVMGYNPSCYTKDIWDASLHCGIDFDCGPDCPVESVTWSEAAAYCNKLSRTHGLQPCYFCTEEDTKGPKCIQVLYYLGRFIYTCEGYRLPTEAEWEYAYRAGTTTSTYGGELSFCESPDPVLDPIAWYWFNSENRPHPVGLKKPNAFGLYDMAGNVSEWVHDLYADYPFGTSTDPNPDVGGLAIVRGGGFTSSPKATRASDRITTTLTYRTRGDGFRCVRSIEAQP